MIQQISHNGVLGMSGPHAVEVVALDNLSERGGVCQPNAQILITEDVREIHMKKDDATNSVAQVSHSKQLTKTA